MSGVAEYVAKDSPIHRLHPLTKLFWSLTVVSASFIFQNLVGQMAVLLSIILVALIGRVLKELIPAFVGLLVVAGIFILFQIFFIPDGKTLLTLIPGTHIGRVTDVGLWACLGMAGRMIVITASFPVMMATTQIKDLVVALVNSLKIPYAYAFMFVTSLRFIPTFIGEMDQIMQALKFGSNDELSNVAGSIFVVSTNRTNDYVIQAKNEHMLAAYFFNGLFEALPQRLDIVIVVYFSFTLIGTLL
ncbi:MAG TPA: energy-coupling factor transporter transmembrane component T [Bacillota bacterium]|nr:energy-coupling factor transporter transmembrane component T [Bacillota bacterium]